jgi:chaperonin GroES
VEKTSRGTLVSLVRRGSVDEELSVPSSTYPEQWSLRLWKDRDAFLDPERHVRLGVYQCGDCDGDTVHHITVNISELLKILECISEKKVRGIGGQVIQLLGNRVLVLPDEDSKKTPGGIILPDTAEVVGNTYSGTVVAAGPGEYNNYTDSTIPMSVEVGDKVIYYKYKDTPKINEGGKECLILTEDQIYTIMSREE